MKNKPFNDIISNNLPKICVPVTGIREDDILERFRELNKAPMDLVELRADFYQFAKDQSKVMKLLERIRKIYDKPLLFTLRTKAEGGVSDIGDDYYFELNRIAIESRLIDLIDIEFFSQVDKAAYTVSLARKNNVLTILSSHDFQKTPPEEEIITRLSKMADCGDIAKVAVMPKTEEDVLTLLSAALKLKKVKKGPFIAISMGPLGIVSRISCELFGSCMTYASYKEQSAPGQIDVFLMKEILKAQFTGI